MRKEVSAIFRMGSNGWVYVEHRSDHHAAEKRLERYKKDMPHETFRLDRLEVHE